MTLTFTTSSEEDDNWFSRIVNLDSKHIKSKFKSKFPEGFYISIMGPIGVGKSTLASQIKDFYGFKLYKESPENNKILPLFYKNMKKYSFLLQISLLTFRFEQQQRINWNKERVIQDRTFYEDNIFAKMLLERGDMSELAYDAYKRLFDDMMIYMQNPNLIIYLTATPEECLRRIKKRGRSMEKGITLDYMKDLSGRYNEFSIKISKKIPVFKFDCTKYPDVKAMVKEIERKWIEHSNVTTIEM